MFKIVKPSQVEFLFNDVQHDHNTRIKSLLSSSERFFCIVAFARYSGFNLIYNVLKKALKRGLKAQFVIGLDFYQTDPLLLKKLLKLSKRNEKLELYVSPRKKGYTFHPKMYVFERHNQTDVITGSANMTMGGLETNNELSVLTHDVGKDFGKYIDALIKSWINGGEIVSAEEDIINQYGEEHIIYKAQKALADHRAKRQTSRKKTGKNKKGSIMFGTLADYLSEMKKDPTKEGFDKQVQSRLACHSQAQGLLSQFASTSALKPKDFLEQYEGLIGKWHSGGLHRGKTHIDKQSTDFCAAINSLDEIQPKPIAYAFNSLLGKFRLIKGAGINVLTEILHTLDNEKFAVMNQNSVHGVSIAYGHEFPDKPTKNNVDGATYEKFCKRASSIRSELTLNNFSELDALFNYIYWLENDGE